MINLMGFGRKWSQPTRLWISKPPWVWEWR